MRSRFLGAERIQAPEQESKKRPIAFLLGMIVLALVCWAVIATLVTEAIR